MQSISGSSVVAMVTRICVNTELSSRSCETLLCTETDISHEVLTRVKSGKILRPCQFRTEVYKVSEIFSTSFIKELHQVTESLNVCWEYKRILILENFVILIYRSSSR
jgi:hypothetical protein